MVLVVPPGHRLAGRRNIELGELDGEDYVGFTQELTIRREVDRQLKRSKVAVQIVHEFDNIETIKRAIEIGSGVAILPRPTVGPEVAAGRLVAVEISGVRLVRPLGIVRKRNRQLTTAVQKFIELLQEDAAAQPRRRKPSRGARLRSRGQESNSGRINGHLLSGAGTGLLVRPRRRRGSSRAT